MNNSVSTFEQVALHICKVAAWVLGSAAVPALISLYSQNPYWLMLTPIINGIGAGLVKWSGIVAAKQAAHVGGSRQP